MLVSLAQGYLNLVSTDFIMQLWRLLSAVIQNQSTKNFNFPACPISLENKWVTPF